jgi:hypothetical protein
MKLVAEELRQQGRNRYRRALIDAAKTSDALGLLHGAMTALDRLDERGVRTGPDFAAPLASVRQAIAMLEAVERESVDVALGMCLTVEPALAWLAGVAAYDGAYGDVQTLVTKRYPSLVQKRASQVVECGVMAAVEALAGVDVRAWAATRRGAR